MPLFRRTRRVDLGSFEAPPAVPPSSLERIVEEGLLISTSAVRMAVKNRIIIGAVRDKLDFDPETLAAAATEELVALAQQNEESADLLVVRLGIPFARSTAARQAAADVVDDDTAHGDTTDGEAALTSTTTGAGSAEPLYPAPELDNPEPEPRELSYRTLAAALWAASQDSERISAIVAGARDDAMQELGGAMKTRLVSTDSNPALNENYARLRAGRMRALVELDLADLMRTSATKNAAADTSGGGTVNQVDADTADAAGAEAREGANQDADASPVSATSTLKRSVPSTSKPTVPSASSPATGPATSMRYWTRGIWQRGAKKR